MLHSGSNRKERDRDIKGRTQRVLENRGLRRTFGPGKDEQDNE
jgi:hypothetical protein